MTPSSRAARGLDDALGQALEDLEAGLTPLQVLDRYPDHEAELGPLLETAYRLRTSRWPTLSLAARVAGREKMHAAVTAEKARRSFVLAPLWRQVGAGVALAALAGATYLASPFSPLPHTQPVTFPGASTVTATWTVTVSPTSWPPATVLAIATPFVGPTLTAQSTADPGPDEEPEVLVTAAPRPSMTLTPLRSATVTPTPTRTPSPTRKATATVKATESALSTAAPAAIPIAGKDDSKASPLPTVAAPASGPSATVTRTPWPTEPAGPTQTATPEPSYTPSPTRLPPTYTPEPTKTASPAPQPTGTKEPAATPHRQRTPTPSETLVPGKTPNPTESSTRARLPELIKPHLHGEPLGQELRAIIKEWRQSIATPRARGNRR